MLELLGILFCSHAGQAAPARAALAPGRVAPADPQGSDQVSSLKERLSLVCGWLTGSRPASG